MLVGLEINLSFLCPHCNLRNPQRGLRLQTRCYNCHEQVDLEAKLADSYEAGIRYYFGGYLDVVYEAVAILKEGDTGRDPGQTFSFKHRRKAPYCPSCRADFAEADVRAGLTVGEIVCKACGAHTPARLADAELAKWDSRLMGVVNDPGDTQSDLAPATSQPTIMACLSCSGPLSVDGAERIVRCTHCGNTNVLPDSVWMTLHPVPKQQPFFLLIDADEIFQLEAQAFFASPEEPCRDTDELDFMFEDMVGAGAVASHHYLKAEQRVQLRAEAREGVARLLASASSSLLEQIFSVPKHRLIQGLLLELPGLPAKFAALAAASTDSSLRALAALRLDLPPEQLMPLVEDPDEAVRLALANRESLPSAATEQLSRDRASSVREIMAAKPELSVAVVERLRADGSEEVRLALAKSPHASPDTLKMLGRDAASAVAEAARSNPHFPKGFLGRLLGW